MKQHGDGHWHGHSEVTTAAVSRLYAHLSGPDGRIMGLSRAEYARALDKAQALKDRAYGAGLIRNFANTGLTVPYAGPGKTMHSAWVNGAAQREHAMADPALSGAENLALIREYVYQNLDAAHASADQEVSRLGAASHALQDSYSGAHAWREDAVYEGEPNAPITTLHVFDPGHAIGVNKNRNTHSDEFDKPPAESGTVRAAVEANYRMLRAYHLNRDKSPEQFRAGIRTAMDPLLTPSTAGVQVSLSPTLEWTTERDRRITLEHGGAPARPPLPSDELKRLRAVTAPTAAAAGGVRQATEASGRAVDGGRGGPGVQGKQPGQGSARE
jgi:hypothetical protein